LLYTPYPSARKITLDSWRVSESLSTVALSHNKIERESPGELNLNDLSAISYGLHKLDDITEPQTRPENPAFSFILKKLWLDLTYAVSGLSQIASTITQLKKKIMN